MTKSKGKRAWSKGKDREIGRWGDGETRRKRINSKAQSFHEIQTVKT